LATFFRELTLERRRQPRNDMVSDLAAVEGESDGLSEEELLGLCVFLFAAGEETTVSLIGNSMLALLRNPDQLERLKNCPELVGSAIEEFLRYDFSLLFLLTVQRRCVIQPPAHKNHLIYAVLKQLPGHELCHLRH
jgi:cytochrome P450